MRCSACGEENDEGLKFCIACGSAFVVRCDACAAENPPGARFCGECGSGLSAGIAPGSSSALPKTPAAERRLVSVLFADLVGFTTLSEGRDPEEVRDLLSRYFETCRRLIERYGGVVEKFIGDAVMAVWGTPVTREDDAERAVRAALELTDAVAAIGEEIGAVELRARAGVLTGEAAVTLGAKGQGMVAGDLVNTASRVQSEAMPGDVYVGDATKWASEAAIAYEDAGAHELKGKAEPVQLWRALRVVAGAGGDMRVTVLEPPFVGRERQLRMVKELFHGSADEGRAHLLSVIGPAGIGKSRLVWEFSKYIDGLAADTRWHVGRCLAYGEGITYWALGEMVRTNADILEGEDAKTALPKLHEAVVAVIPDPDEQRWVEPRLASLLGVEAGPAREREDLFAAWRLFYERLAAEMPTIMVFEDLHWADDALLDFIDYLMEWSRNHRLFVLTLARHELLERRPDWASARRNSTSIHLEPLAGGAMEDLLSGLAPGLPEALSARVLDRAEGVPLYAVETVRMLLDRGLLTQEEGGFRPTGSIEELDVPETLHGLLAARLDGLEPDERRLMQDASVLGKTFAKEAIAAVSGAAPDRLEEMLAALLRKELLAVEAERFSPERGQYVFLGDLVRWVAYETLSKKERKSRHLAVASWFEQLPEEDAIEMVAGHYLRAYEAEPGAEDAASIRDRAQLALTKAAERAASLGANAEAGRRFEQAAQMAGSDLDRAGLLERAGGMAMRELDHERGRALFSEGMSIYERHSLSHPAARVSARLAELDYIQGHLEDAIARMREAFDVLSTEEHDRDLAMLAGALGRMHFFLGEMGEAAQMIEVALEIGERLALPDVISDALNTKSIIVSAHGRYEEGSALITHALEIAVEHDLPTTALRAYNNVAETETDRDRYDDGLSQYERGLALAERVGDGVWLRGLRSETVFPLLMTGRWDEALESAAKVPDSEKAGPDIIGLLVSIPVIHIARGDIDAAEQIVHLFDRYGRSSDVQQTAAFACARASVLRARSRNEEAMASAREAVEGGLQLGTIATMKIGLTQGLAAAFALGDLDGVEQQIDIVDGMTPGMVTPFLRALADRWRARVVAARGGDAGVESAFKTSIGLFREMGVPYWRAITQVEYGEWLMSAGRFEDAKPAFEESRETFEYLSASARLEQLDRIAEPLRVD